MLIKNEIDCSGVIDIYHQFESWLSILIMLSFFYGLNSFITSVKFSWYFQIHPLGVNRFMHTQKTFYTKWIFTGAMRNIYGYNEEWCLVTLFNYHTKHIGLICEMPIQYTFNTYLYKNIIQKNPYEPNNFDQLLSTISWWEQPITSRIKHACHYIP